MAPEGSVRLPAGFPVCSSSHSTCTSGFSSCLKAQQEADPDPGVEFWRKSSDPTGAAQPNVWIHSPSPMAAQSNAWHCTCMFNITDPFHKNQFSQFSPSERFLTVCRFLLFFYIHIFLLFITLWKRLELKIKGAAPL